MLAFKKAMLWQRGKKYFIISDHTDDIESEEEEEEDSEEAE